MIFLKKFFNLLKATLPFLATVVIIVALQFIDSPYVRIYPALISLLFFLSFFLSTFAKETIIQKMAKAMNPDLTPRALDYTRKLTYVWSFVMFIMLLISIATIFMSKEFFELYHGLISYIIVGTVFTVEHFVRVRYKKESDKIYGTKRS